MGTIAAGMAACGVATLRFNFPYMERGSRRPDPPATCHAVIRAAAAQARHRAPDLPLIAGGRSFGGRMTSQAHAQQPLPAVRGLLFFGFPLHPAGRPGIQRAEHLRQIRTPMLFLQGTRDKLAQLDLLHNVVDELQTYATLHLLDDADHEFRVRARTGRTAQQVETDWRAAVSLWLDALSA